ncbi:MAG: metal-dependent transcriptional regulator [Candidatus Helarchaeota archaeon]|nr:metal-dependent transcriptional regulator [Candidatus Helarchaeota archaeon]
MNGLSPSVEDYLEAILKLIEHKGYAQTKDIAEEMNVKPPSVSGMLIKLKKQGFINYEPYSAITLTPLGKESARKVLEGHNIIKELLKYLGVPDKVAEDDACAMEHQVHSKTIIQIKKFIKFIESFPETPEWLVSFRKYSKKSSK